MVLFLLLLSSCAPRIKRIPPNPSNPIFTVALLPVYNVTADIDGPQKIREEFFKRISRYNYSAKPIAEVDRLLQDQMGITLGSQLDLTNPQKIGEVLGVDGLVYGYLLDYSDLTLGIYNVRMVKAGFKLVNAKTGSVMWSRGQGVKSVLVSEGMGEGLAVLKELRDAKDGLEDFNLIPGIKEIPGLKDWHIMKIIKVKEARDAAIISLGKKVIGKALGIHLKAETKRMMKIILRGFPAGPGSPNSMASPVKSWSVRTRVTGKELLSNQLQ
jgi:hypothetical protein